MTETPRKIKVISQSERERADIDAEIHRHSVALLRALRRLRLRYPQAAELTINALAEQIALTSQNG